MTNKKTLTLTNKRIVQGPKTMVRVKTRHNSNIILENGIEISMKDADMKTGCLVKGTNVITSQGIKRIEDIKIGDLVYSHDFDLNSHKPHKVVMNFKFDRQTWLVGFDDGSEIQCSSNHKFLKDLENPEDINSWVSAEDITDEDEIWKFSESLDEKVKTKPVYKSRMGIQTVYDITVEDTHSYLTANGIINHNSL